MRTEILLSPHNQNVTSSLLDLLQEFPCPQKTNQQKTPAVIILKFYSKPVTYSCAVIKLLLHIHCSLGRIT